MISRKRMYEVRPLKWRKAWRKATEDLMGRHLVAEGVGGEYLVLNNEGEENSCYFQESLELGPSWVESIKSLEDGKRKCQSDHARTLRKWIKEVKSCRPKKSQNSLSRKERMMKKTRITITVPREVDAYIVDGSDGKIVVHRSIDSWTDVKKPKDNWRVTHVPTGLRFPTSFIPTREEAVVKAKEIIELILSKYGTIPDDRDSIAGAPWKGECIHD
jgi:hypothetical protein